MKTAVTSFNWNFLRTRLVATLFVVMFLTSCTSLWHSVNYAGPNDISITSSNSPLASDAFRAAIELASPGPPSFKAGERAALHVIVTNKSSTTWPAGRTATGAYQISVGNHWRDEQGTLVAMDDARSSLPFDLHPGERAEILLNVTPPNIPGRYHLEVDLAQEQVAWFAEKGSQVLSLNITVLEP